MASDAFQQWYVQGLQAVKTAVERSREASRHGGGDASGEGREMMEAGAKVFGEHADQLDRLLGAVGGGGGRTPNPFMDGIQAGSREMIEAARDPAVRDASLVAAAQIAIHYFIAAYGTLASNAKHLGRAEDAATLKGMADEMKAGDERFTAVAEEMANRRASAGA